MSSTVIKKQELLKWLKFMRRVSSVDIQEWGLQHSYTCAGRRSREYAEKGVLNRLTKEDKTRLDLNTKLAYFEYNNPGEQLNLI